MIRFFAILSFAFLLLSCCNDKPTDFSKTPTIHISIINNDTCNITDEKGWRQGKWVPHFTNKLKDTVFYRNDTILSK